MKCILAALAACAITALPCIASPVPVDPALLAGLHWRAIGPAMFAGRVTDIAGVSGDPYTLYVAHASAGLFKSTNGGITWESIFNDGNTLSIGAIALAPDNPNVIYVGTGEGFPRNSASFGDGMYKSTDGGKTWKHIGLNDTERFARIVVSSTDPSVVFAAAMGHEWAPNQERGLYRSSDGGETWHRVLYVNDTTGAGDVCLDPQDPRIVYAGMYDYLRQPWHFRSGGPGSGLYRSSDGGETWAKLTDPKLNNGLPAEGPIGRIGIAVSPSNPAIVYATIETRHPGVLWRSDDRGLHWRVVNSDRAINFRPFYFSRVTVDPADPDRVYSVSRSLFISRDGGHTFREVRYYSMFGDNHVTWVDPKNPNRVLAGSDGGAWQSTDRGEHWEPFNNIPMAQAYHVGLDMEDPYWVMGGFQDHEIWRGPNERWNEVGVRNGDWRRMRGHADGMYAIPDPRDPNIIYYNGETGDITRFDARTQEERYIQPYPIGGVGYGANLQKYRFNWNSPIHMSRENPEVVYFGGNVLFKTTNGGQTWTVISPDLTTNDLAKQKLSGGPINPDNTHAEYYCTITSIAESPQDSKVIWAGTDDGNVQVTRDGGAHWTNVIGNIHGAPASGWVTSIHSSFKSAGTAYVAIDQHRMNDFHPHAFMTSDYGETWKDISRGLNGYVHVIMEDPKEPSLLYAGTELGIFISLDRGDDWTDFRLGLPRLPVRDMEVHPRDNDLVIATHARGFYVLDDITQLQQLARAISRRVTLFKPMQATRYIPVSDVSSLGDRVWVAKNKPYGAIISYYLATQSHERAQLTILDSRGRTIRVLPGPATAGINRAVWDLRQAGCPGVSPKEVHGPGISEGPRVMPGAYAVQLRALGETTSQQFTVRVDPRVHVSSDDLARYEREMTQITQMQCSVDSALQQIGSINRQLSQKHKLPGQTQEVADRLRAELNAIKVELSPNPRDPEHLNLKSKIDALSTEIQAYTGRPTDAQVQWTGIFDEQLQPLLRRLNATVHENLTKINDELRASGVPAITP